MVDLLISKEHIHTFYYKAKASLDKEKTMMKRETSANVRKRAVREIKEVSQDTTCVRLGLHIKRKGNVLGWGRSSLKTA